MRTGHISEQSPTIPGAYLSDETMGYDEIIVNYFISATSKGFSVFHYPIAFFKGHRIIQSKSFFPEAAFFQGSSKVLGTRH